MLKSCLIFVTGVAAGTGVTWFFMNKKLEEERKTREDRINKAIEQVKNAYSNSEKNQEMKSDVAINRSAAVADVEKNKEYVRLYTTIDKTDPMEEDTYIALSYISSDDVVLYDSSLTVVENPEEILGDNYREELLENGELSVRDDTNGIIYDVDVNNVDTLEDIIGKSVDDSIVAMDEGGA